MQLQEPETDRVTALPPESRAARRKRETEARLLDAGLQAFCARGYDAATTGEVASVADVAAGTFYAHFRDKRALYERLAAETAREIIGKWREALDPEMPNGVKMVLGLQLTALYWRANLDRTRLLLEGGPSLGSQGHQRFIDAVSEALDGPEQATSAGSGDARAMARLAVGLGIELGRLIAARPEAEQEVENLIQLMRAFEGR